jgi:hypothetical protein
VLESVAAFIRTSERRELLHSLQLRNCHLVVIRSTVNEQSRVPGTILWIPGFFGRKSDSKSPAQSVAVMGAIAMEVMPHQRGFGNSARSPSLTYSPTRTFKKSPGITFRHSRSHHNLPVRVRRKASKRSSDDDATPPPSPKRSNPGNGARPLKQSKRGEIGESVVSLCPLKLTGLTSSRTKDDANRV